MIGGILCYRYGYADISQNNRSSVRLGVRRTAINEEFRPDKNNCHSCLCA
jgi:hypothetical protein